jgi:hypothetical protein
MSVTTEVPLSLLGEFAKRLPEPGAVDVTIEVLGAELGDQLLAQRLPWHALIHDETNQVVEVSVGGRDHKDSVALRHEVHHPSRVFTEEDAGSVRAISIEAEDGVRTIIRFHERPSLDAGH